MINALFVTCLFNFFIIFPNKTDGQPLDTDILFLSIFGRREYSLSLNNRYALAYSSNNSKIIKTHLIRCIYGVFGINFPILREGDLFISKGALLAT